MVIVTLLLGAVTKVKMNEQWDYLGIYPCFLVVAEVVATVSVSQPTRPAVSSCCK